MKQVLIKIRTSIKFMVLLGIATFLILGAVIYIYKPIYKVTLNGEQIGYCTSMSKMQEKIEKYTEEGNGENGNIAFVAIDEMPEYKMCLLKRNIVTNDDEIFEKIKNTGITYYRYYAILDGEEEKKYVSDFQSAENIVDELKEKDSSNIDNIAIIEKYDTELKEFSNIEDVVSSLYVEKVKPKVVVASNKSTGRVNTSSKVSNTYASLGISLIRPVGGTISSRFGAISSRRSSAHTGLDIATSYGAAISAAASGTVSFAGTKGSYGKLIVIDHGNGVQTYYGHCSNLYVSAGQKVSQGQKIAAVGSTGNSTGPHLHLEVRINGVAYNPQNYVY